MKRLILYLGLVILFTFLMFGLLNLKDYSVVPTQDGLNKQTVELIKPLEMPKAVEVATKPKIAVKPVQAPVVAPVASGDCSLAFNYPWPQKIAYAVCMAESGGRVGAVNWGDNHGSCIGSFSLFQLGCFWYPYYGYSSADFYNPKVNVEIAFKIWQRQGGFGAWSAYTNGAFNRYL